jgi:hypothetical protein
MLENTLIFPRGADLYVVFIIIHILYSSVDDSLEKSCCKNVACWF